METEKIEDLEKYRWEWLVDDTLNKTFKNDVPPDKRKAILSKLDISQEQGRFLLRTFNIDWLAIKDEKPVLIEEKGIGIQRLKGCFLDLTCNIPTQPATLQRATEINIEAGVLARFKIWGKLGHTWRGSILRHKGYDDGTIVVLSRFYCWGESAFPNGTKIRLVDDFQQMAIKLDSEGKTLNKRGL